MPVALQSVGELIERFAPLRFACDWDNSGFNINLGGEVENILVCLDVTNEIIEEAHEKKCSLIAAHHPLFFKGIKNIDTGTYEGRMAASLIRYGISLYCAHTSMDSSPWGINFFLARQLGLTNITIIESTAKTEYDQIGVYVPAGHEENVARAMGLRGAGLLGKYSDCAWQTRGTGQFMPLEGSNPFIGRNGILEKVNETKIEVLCERSNTKAAIQAMKAVHPYEEAAYYVIPLSEPKPIAAGMGVAGDFEEVLTVRNAADILKNKLGIDSVRIAGNLDKEIKRAGICGGSAGDLIAPARKIGCELFITGEVKHNFYVAETDIAIIEAGHFDTEKCFVQLFSQGLQKHANELQYKLNIYISENVNRSFSNY